MGQNEENQLEELAVQSQSSTNVIGCTKSMQCDKSYDYHQLSKTKKDLMKDHCNFCLGYKYYHCFD